MPTNLRALLVPRAHWIFHFNIPFPACLCTQHYPHLSTSLYQCASGKLSNREYLAALLPGRQTFDPSACCFPQPSLSKISTSSFHCFCTLELISSGANLTVNSIVWTDKTLYPILSESKKIHVQGKPHRKSETNMLSNDTPASSLLTWCLDPHVHSIKVFYEGDSFGIGACLGKLVLTGQCWVTQRLKGISCIKFLLSKNATECIIVRLTANNFCIAVAWHYKTLVLIHIASNEDDFGW